MCDRGFTLIPGEAYADRGIVCRSVVPGTSRVGVVSVTSGGGVIHLRSLTSLRFVAAMLVLAHHLVLFTPGLGGLSLLAAPGYVGVTFFFVLSGFVLTWSWDPGAGALRFYRRRFARVYPVHLLFIALAIVTVHAPPNWSAMPANVLLVHSWSPDDAVARSFSGVSWSLSCEFFFYAVFPLLVRRFWRIRRLLVTGIALVATAFVVGIAVQSRSPDWSLWLFHLPAFRIVEFACGALAAIAMMRGWTPRLRMRWAAVFVAVSYLTALVLPAVIGYRLEDRWALTLLMVPSVVAVIAVCAHVDAVGAPSPLQLRTMVSLGQWSYCIYMAHPVVLSLMMPLLGASSVVGAALGGALVVLAIVGVSFLLFAGFEQPLERRLRGGGQRASNAPDAEIGLGESSAQAPPRPNALATD